jgi:hypothetical protein
MNANCEKMYILRHCACEALLQSLEAYRHNCINKTHVDSFLS